MSRITDWSDRGTCVLFGDGAGAVILEPSEEAGILSTHLHADGKYEDLLTVDGGISTDYQKIVDGNAFMRMKGNEVFKVAVNTLGLLEIFYIFVIAKQKDSLDENTTSKERKKRHKRA